MIAIAWGLIGALLIGTSDTIARITSQRISITILILIIMGFSSFIMTIWFLYSWEWPQWHLYGWITSIISGFLNLIAVAFLYKALARGPVYVASPATASYSVILVLINIFIGELFTFTQVIASIVVFIGITMLSIKTNESGNENNFSNTWLRNTAFLGLAAGLTIALRFFLAQESIEFLGAEQSLYINRLSAFFFIFLFFTYTYYKKKKFIWPNAKILYLVIIQAILETLALGAFLYGSLNNGRIGATIGFSTFALVTSILSWLWLKERIPPNKFIWILVITIAIILSIIFAPNI